jgi:hypothetical protein
VRVRLHKRVRGVNPAVYPRPGDLMGDTSQLSRVSSLSSIVDFDRLSIAYLHGSLANRTTLLLIARMDAECRDLAAPKRDREIFLLRECRPLSDDRPWLHLWAETCEGSIFRAAVKLHRGTERVNDFDTAGFGI